MFSLAQVLVQKGLVVTGSDMQDSASVEQLRELGIPVFIGHQGQQVANADAVIRTAAVHNDNPEIAYALDHGIPVFERAQAWGGIMQAYDNALCISGTHGKTTTTGMCTHILLAAQRDPTVMIGGTLPVLNTSYRVGNGNTIVLESCEYCNSFLYFYPTTAVILNIEEDHLDFFKDLKDIQKSFRQFAQSVPETGMVIANGEDRNTMEAVDHLDRPVLTFGLDSGDVHARGLTWDHGRASFDVICQGNVFAHVTLAVPGIHNVKNALAAAAVAYTLGADRAAVEQGLAEFTGVKRRFEWKGTYHGAQIYDDYAHHPSEIRALLETAQTLGYQRIICVFQPHTYSRTKALFSSFSEVLQMADQTLLAEIYAARETDTLGVSSAALAETIPGSRAYASFAELEESLKQMARPGDLILTVGAGDIYQVGEAMVRENQS